MHPVYAIKKLNSTRLKVIRAEKHLVELERRVARSKKVHIYGFRREFDTERRVYIYHGPGSRRFPDEWGLIMGDWAQNLRASLDHLICSLALHNGKKACDGTQFPIFTSDPFRQEAKPELRKRFLSQLAGVTEEAIDLVKALQPYRSTELVPPRIPDEHFLAVLASASNTDKHRGVVTMGRQLRFPVKPSMNIRRLKNGSTKIEVPANLEPEKGFESQIAYRIAFRIPRHREGLGPERLRDLHNLVRDKVIPAFAGFFE
jgi:hypothetical protein